MLQNNLDLPSHTISDWKQFVHEVILDHVEENSEQIGGIDCIVQIDESILEKRKYNLGRAVEGQWVFVEWKEVQNNRQIQDGTNSASEEKLRNQMTLCPCLQILTRRPRADTQEEFNHMC
ncbi:hypothetical protein TNCV_1045571 [Trichonephila clavipes]|nr:hypothetical protein TNCV_1045571 [Trichonephila clavipes]